MQSMNKVSIICPVFSNDGASLLPIIHCIAKEVAMLTGGVSRQNAHEGTWYDQSGTEYTEPSIILWTVCNDATLHQLSTRFEEWRASLQQIALLVVSERVNAIFVENNAENAKEVA